MNERNYVRKGLFVVIKIKNIRKYNNKILLLNKLRFIETLQINIKIIKIIYQ